ncbi:MAG: T9SS type A sorting domain-containing protein [Crocinitomicaceae bacterium]|nr:T9SS type A sorting domain-containing protein [Crocinitomicaceae bacterium]
MKNVINIKIGALVASCILCSSVLFSQQKGAFLDWVIQTEGSGDMLGHRIFDVTKTSTNDIITVGLFSHTVNFNPLFQEVLFTSDVEDPETARGYFSKYSEQGELEWIKIVTQGRVGIHFVKTDHQDNIYIAGVMQDTVDFDLDPASSHLLGATGSEYFVASYDTDGNFRWVFKLEKMTTNSFLKIKDIAVNEATQTISVTGHFSNSINFSSNTSNPVIKNTQGMLQTHIFLANYSLEGELNWVNTFDNSRSTLGTVHDYYRVASDEEGNVFLSGLFMDSLQLDPVVESAWVHPLYGERESFLVKHDKNGVYQWHNTVRGEAFQVVNIAYNNGYVYLTGGSGSDITFYYNADLDSTIIEKEDSLSGLFFVSQFHSNSGEFTTIIEKKAYESIHGGTYLLSFDNYNNIYLSGQFRFTGYIDFNPLSDEEFNVTQNSHHQETFLAKYTQEGEFKWAFGMPGGTFTEGKGIVALNDGVVIVGEYRGSPDVSAYGETPIIISTDFSPSINHHSFIAKYSQGFLNTLEEGLSNNEILLFPNPSQHTNTLVFKNPASTKTRIDLYDIQGRLIQPVYQGIISEGMEIEVDISGLSSGMYLYRVTDNTMQQALKFIKE